VTYGSAAKDGCEDREKEKNHCAKKERQVTELPDKRLQGVKFHEAGILFDAVDDKRRDEARENLKQMREKCHGALVLRWRRQ
jgi:hypothetical protein